MTQSFGPIFVPYAVTCVILCMNLVALWAYSGVIRTVSMIAINPEDGVRFGAPLSETDPPAVARVLRAHRNAEATIYPFLFLGLVYVAVGGKAWIAAPVFATFAIARIVHSICYLRGIQPWRTGSFVVSAGAIVTLLVAVMIGIAGL